jgi:hypothetical protein
MEALIGPRLKQFGYRPATDAVDTPTALPLRVRKDLYHANFAARFWLKMCTPLGERFSDSALLEDRPELDTSDVTLRPGKHRDCIRQMVASS